MVSFVSKRLNALVFQLVTVGLNVLQLVRNNPKNKMMNSRTVSDFMAANVGRLGDVAEFCVPSADN